MDNQEAFMHARRSGKSALTALKKRMADIAECMLSAKDCHRCGRRPAVTYTDGPFTIYCYVCYPIFADAIMAKEVAEGGILPLVVAEWNESTEVWRA